MEESARGRKRDSARKKSEFSVYSQKAVRAKEQQRAVGQKVQRAKPFVVHDNGFSGQNLCVAKVKDKKDKKESKK
jgi:hypothetical protein